MNLSFGYTGQSYEIPPPTNLSSILFPTAESNRRRNRSGILYFNPACVVQEIGPQAFEDYQFNIEAAEVRIAFFELTTDEYRAVAFHLGDGNRRFGRDVNSLDISCPVSRPL